MLDCLSFPLAPMRFYVSEGVLWWDRSVGWSDRDLDLSWGRSFRVHWRCRCARWSAAWIEVYAVGCLESLDQTIFAVWYLEFAILYLFVEVLHIFLQSLNIILLLFPGLLPSYPLLLVLGWILGSDFEEGVGGVSFVYVWLWWLLALFNILLVVDLYEFLIVPKLLHRMTQLLQI